MKFKCSWKNWGAGSKMKVPMVTTDLGAPDLHMLANVCNGGMLTICCQHSFPYFENPSDLQDQTGRTGLLSLVCGTNNLPDKQCQHWQLFSKINNVDSKNLIWDVLSTPKTDFIVENIWLEVHSEFSMGCRSSWVLIYVSSSIDRICIVYLSDWWKTFPIWWLWTYFTRMRHYI